jgi:hypothetical protein
MNDLHTGAIARNEILSAPYSGILFVSFTRAISGAPTQNRRAVFRLIAADCQRRCVEDLRALAEASGLVETFGAVTVEDDLSVALRWRQS